MKPAFFVATFLKKVAISMKKVALLFLTINNHNKPKIWEKFLKGNKYFNIYCHPKEAKKVSNSFLKDNIVDNLRKTSWEHLVLAYYQLLKSAYCDKENYKFVFVSDSCIPVKKPEKVYKALLSTKKSLVDTNHRLNKWDLQKRYSPYKKILEKLGIKKDNLVKHTGWFCLNRRDSKLILSKYSIIKVFNEMPAGDEFFLSILVAKNRKFKEKAITCVDFSQGIKNYKEYIKKKTVLWKKHDSEKNHSKKKELRDKIHKMKVAASKLAAHPREYTKITKEDLALFKKRGCLFARKFI